MNTLSGFSAGGSVDSDCDTGEDFSGIGVGVDSGTGGRRVIGLDRVPG